jgi:hypothetical protein
LITSGKARYEKYQPFENDSLKIRNEPIANLAVMLTIQGKRLPIVVDETGYTSNIDIEISFPKNTAGIDDVNRELAKYDLVLRPREYKMDMLVIKD